MSRNQGAKAPSQRQLRVGEEIRHALAEVLERGEIRDPDVAARPITITEVRVSPDLRNATVFAVPLGGGDTGSMLAGLKRVRPYLRHELSRRLRLRVVPDLSFQPDTSFDVAGRIDALLRNPEVRRDLEDVDQDIDDALDHDGLDEGEARDDGA